jgi:hypothetical protein
LLICSVARNQAEGKNSVDYVLKNRITWEKSGKQCITNEISGKNWITCEKLGKNWIIFVYFLNLWFFFRLCSRLLLGKIGLLTKNKTKTGLLQKNREKTGLLGKIAKKIRILDYKLIFFSSVLPIDFSCQNLSWIALKSKVLSKQSIARCIASDSCTIVSKQLVNCGPCTNDW